MPCVESIDEARVTIDVSLLERAAEPTVLLGVAVLLSVVGLSLALRVAPPGHRWWALLHLVFTPLAALFGWFSSRQGYAVSLACFEAPTRGAGHVIALGAALMVLCFVQLTVSLTLRAWKPGPPLWWPAGVLALGALVGGGVALHKHRLQREFAQRLAAVTPIPNVRAPAAPPEAHVGHAVRFTPQAEAAGEREGFFFPSRVWLSAEQARAWGVGELTLTSTRLGREELPVHFARDLVQVDATLAVLGVEDRGPDVLPLAVGNRFEFVGVTGRGGSLARLEKVLRAGKKPLPAPTFTLEVTGEGERDGFHVFELEVTRGTERVPETLVRRDGELVRLGGGRVVFLDAGQCRVSLLTPSTCDCAVDHVERCVDVRGDVGEGLLRVFLGFVSLGLTEFRGMGDLGSGNELGLLATRWRIAGVERSVAPTVKVKGR